MVRIKKVLALAGSVLLLASAGACSDGALRSLLGGEELAPSFNARADERSPRDVPEVAIDLPPRARAWDNNPAALARAVEEGGGYAVVAFKEPGSARALATGRRGAVTAGTVTAGLQLLRQRGAQVVELLDAIGAARVRISPKTAADLAAHPLVDFVEPRQYGEVQAQTTPSGVTLVHAPEFWSSTTKNGAGVRIEIIDTGHQQGHPDLPAVPSTNCAGIFGGCNDNATVNWHGTHILGIIAARNNTEGMVGVAPGIAPAEIYMYGACDSAGRCPTDEVSAGINAGIWNAQIMNLSLVQPFDLAQSTAVGQAWSNGIILVAAAGNNMTNTVTYPAGYANVIGVSGVKPDKSFASSTAASSCGTYSNQGTHVDLAAPIESYSTIGGSSYNTQCGTSMASAYVSGVAALLKSQNPTWTNQQIADSLFARAEDLGTAGKDALFGHGLARPVRPAPLAAGITGPASITAAGTSTWLANASGGYGTYTYKWEHRPTGGTTWTQVGTGSSYARAVNAGPSFELRVTVTSGGIVVTDTHVVTVSIPPSTTVTGPTSITTAGTYTWQSSPKGGDGTYTYSWDYRVQGATSWTSVSSTTSSYSRAVAPGDPPFELRSFITSAGATGFDTHLVSVVSQVSASITGPASINAAGTYTWAANAAGGNGTYTYSWEQRPQGGATWTAVGTASSYSRAVATSDAPFELRVTVTSAGLTGADTHLVGVVAPVTAGITGTASVTSAGTYTWTAGAGGGTGTYAYAWEYRVQNGTWTSVGTAASYSRAVSPGDPAFELRVTVTSGGLTGSDTHLVSVIAPVGASISGTTGITSAGTYTWQASASGGNGTYSYSWEYRPQGGAWTSVGTGSSYSRSVAAGNPAFELRVTVTSGGLTGSDTHLVDVDIATAPTTTVTGSDYLMSGEMGTWAANAGGGNGTYTYQWQYRTEISTTWNNGGTASTYSRSAIRSFYVRVIVTSGGLSTTSAEYYVYVEPTTTTCDSGGTMVKCPLEPQVQ